MTARIVTFGGYDTTKPRVRLLVDALRRAEALHGEIAVEVWGGVADKSIAGWRSLLGAAWRWISGMPGALWRLRNADREAHVLLPYPATPEVFLASWFAPRKQEGRLILDAFLPIHDTIVSDRKMVADGGLAARLLRALERAGLRRADLILVDTDAHGDFLASEYAIDRDKFVTVLVGAEPLFAPDAPVAPVDDLMGNIAGAPIILFYGQMIPLHGLQTILQAIAKSDPGEFRWLLVGKGQETPRLEQFLKTGGRSDVIHLPWVDYSRLPSLIANADIALGIFGASGKASRVVPNKLFQILAMGKRVVTRKSPAVDPLAQEHPETILTVPPEDPEALLAAIRDAVASEATSHAMTLRLGPDSGVNALLARLERD